MTFHCAIIGATGLAGQQFLAALVDHPFLRITKLAASARSAGKRFVDAITQENGALAWYVEQDALAPYADMIVEDGTSMTLDGVDLVFSAVESDPAKILEPKFAKDVPVISAASAFRYEPDVPIIIPAVNGHHAELLRVQQAKRGWKGFIVPIPNCTTTGMAIALAPLHAAFGVEKVVMTSLQAVSGAGRSPGVIALDIVDNVIPFIKGEEAKVEKETKKLLGHVSGDTITPAPVKVSATCTRVPVLEGHTETVAVSLSRPATIEEAADVMRAFGRDVSKATHPTAPTHWITVQSDPFRPQPRRDRDNDDGMTTTVGRLRTDDVLGEHGLKFVLVSHNTKMGAAKGAILVAEDLVRRGFIQG
ncbi:aspartate-semialdehyde dehydrogenase [Myxococcota bacterium]|nr:aspartate-semialdehyde dehydrogenase [Myxococcota bacterium]